MGKRVRYLTLSALECRVGARRGLTRTFGYTPRFFLPIRRSTSLRRRVSMIFTAIMDTNGITHIFPKRQKVQLLVKLRSITFFLILPRSASPMIIRVCALL